MHWQFAQIQESVITQKQWNQFSLKNNSYFCASGQGLESEHINKKRKKNEVTEGWTNLSN